MKSSDRVGRTAGLILILLTIVAASGISVNRASAQTLTTLVSFNNSDGAYPSAALIADANGDLFGTTSFGGASEYGTVFEIPRTAGGYASTPTTLVSFNLTDGAYPFASLIADADGDLFGTTEGGGAIGYGTVFEIARTTGGYASTPTTLVSFNGTDGAFPYAGLIADANGNLFGITSFGGATGYGTVFEIAKTASGYASTPTTLVNFNVTDGANPFASLIADADGDLFGTTFYGGANGAGTVFEIARTAGGYASTPTTLVSFNYTDGAAPGAGLIADANGDLFGTTQGGTTEGGVGSPDGTVFEIPYTAGGYASTPTTLVSFNGIDGAYPMAGLIADANGNLFGTTQAGGSPGSGTVFEIPRTAGGYASTPTTLVNFNYFTVIGAYPLAGLIADANGNLFGTTQQGGVEGGLYGYGTVFEVTGSGFVPLRRFMGTPGAPNCIGLSISTLAHTYGGIAHAAKTLGYASVAALQNSVTAYCGN